MALSLGTQHEYKLKYKLVNKKFLDRYKNKQCSFLLYNRLADLEFCSRIIIVIPAYKEEVEMLSACLASLDKAARTDSIRVLLLINYRSSDSSDVKKKSIETFKIMESQRASYSNFKLSVFIEELQGKKAGVGMARKELMDCAYLLFNSTHKNGLIINLDADCTVHENYLSAITKYFKKENNVEAASIRISHNPDIVAEGLAIINYELHLRYFINMQKWIGLPYAFQTVGSAMAVRSDAYAKEGGMVLKQAGEDFYFLHKYSKNLMLGEINETCVYPSSRPSDRVPFGTGKAVQSILDKPKEQYSSYNPESFIILKAWIEDMKKALFDTSKSLSYPLSKNHSFNEYLLISDFGKAYLNDVVTTKAGLLRVKKFFQWFDAFRLFKYLHYMRDKGLHDRPMLDCARTLFDLIALSCEQTEKAYLDCLREYDSKSDYYYQWRAAFMTSPSSTSAS